MDNTASDGGESTTVSTGSFTRVSLCIGPCPGTSALSLGGVSRRLVSSSRTSPCLPGCISPSFNCCSTTEYKSRMSELVIERFVRLAWITSTRYRISSSWSCTSLSCEITSGRRSSLGCRTWSIAFRLRTDVLTAG